MRDYQKILLSCTFAIGDVVMATSAAALLKKIYPKCYIAMMVKPLAEEIVVNNPVIDEVIAPKYQQKKLSFAVMKESLTTIRQGNYDLFLSLDGKLRPALLAFMAGISKRVGPDEMFGSNTQMPGLLTDIVKVGDFKTTHYTETLRQMIEFITGSREQALPVLPIISSKSQRKAGDLIRSLPQKQAIIGLCVKTNPRKTWPAEKFIQLIDKMAEQYEAAFYVVGGDYDHDYVETIASAAQAPVKNFCGQTNLMELIALLKETDLFISLDTAPMHLASAADIPLVAIFGCTAPQSVAPLSSCSTVVAPVRSCIPCVPLRVAVFPGISRRTGPKACPTHDCMQDVTVEDVLEAVKKTIKMNLNQTRGNKL